MKNKLKSFIILFLILSVVFIILLFTTKMFLKEANNTKTSDSIESSISQIVSPYIKDANNKGDTASAVVVGVLMPTGDKKVFSYGVNPATGKKPDSQSIFHIGSISKTFTALLVSSNVVNGKMKLEEPPDAYLSSGITTPSFDGKKMTFLDLLIHSSGLPKFPTNFKGDVSSYTPTMFYDFLNSYQLPYAPGTKLLYSNVGFQVAGRALVDFSGKTYDQLIKEVIADPLKMPNTSMSLSDNQKEKVVTGYKNGSSVPLPEFEIFGAGGLVSNADDMLNLLKVLSGLDKSLLSEEIQLVTTSYKERSPGVYVGLGLDSIVKDDIGNTFFIKGGSGFGYKAQILFSNNPSSGVVVLSKALD